MINENNISQYSIEIASLEDLTHILSLQKLAFEAEAIRYSDFSIPPMTQTIQELREEYKSSIILKYVANWKIVGSVRALMDENNVCHIGRLVVSPSHQGKGIGTSLMHNIEKRFPQCEYFQIFTGVRSHQTIKLYSKLKYKIQSEKQQGKSILVIMTKCNRNLNK